MTAMTVYTGPVATTVETRTYNVLGQLTGLTAGAVNLVYNYGIMVGGKNHLMKAEQSSQGLQDLLNTGKLNASDSDTATTLLTQLNDSLK